jgi:hypothetical protein
MVRNIDKMERRAIPQPEEEAELIMILNDLGYVT